MTFATMRRDAWYTETNLRITSCLPKQVSEIRMSAKLGGTSKLILPRHVWLARDRSHLVMSGVQSREIISQGALSFFSPRRSEA